MKRVFLPCIVAVLVIAAMVYQANTPETTLCELPDVHLGELEGFTSETLEMSENERHVLPEDTIIEKRVYTADDGNFYSVTMVFGGRSKSSIHRPELCLPSQGFLMTNPHDLRVGKCDWRVIVLDGNGKRPSLGFAYTFFNHAGFRTSSHLKRIFRDVWDRSLFNRIDRWVMVTVNASVADDARLAAFLEKLKEVVE